jgi:hypothetical protein
MNHSQQVRTIDSGAYYFFDTPQGKLFAEKTKDYTRV